MKSICSQLLLLHATLDGVSDDQVEKRADPHRRQLRDAEQPESLMRSHGRSMRQVPFITLLTCYIKIVGILEQNHQ